MDQATTERPGLKLVRHYAVAPEKVWRAWTDPQKLKRWFGPQPGDVVTLAETDLRVGGRYHIMFTQADGEVHDVSGVYQEVVPNRKLVFSWAWISTPERVSQVTITLTSAGSGTDMEFVHERFFDQKARDGHNQGWTMGFEKLAAFLAAD
jgi:uncharacterized protein YndB with AHSA1/START domain